jgi:putative component of membrane protein insertase Oxa1/YidC/SpoIIIJ protein YidD
LGAPEGLDAAAARRVKCKPFSTASDSVPENKMLKNERKARTMRLTVAPEFQDS